VAGSLDVLDVLDGGDLISISFDDLLKYHGRSSVAGVAHGFKVMQAAFPRLSPEQPPQRREVDVETAFPGPGARDAFEMVTRAVIAGRFRVATDLAGPDAPEAPEGRFFFRLGYRGATVDLTLLPGHVTDEFIDLVRREVKSPADEERLAALKQAQTDRLLSLPADDVYEARVVLPDS
jgi:hypothetical protein